MKVNSSNFNTSAACPIEFLSGTFYAGALHSYDNTQVTSAHQCRQKCIDDRWCDIWTYMSAWSTTCFLKEVDVPGIMV